MKRAITRLIAASAIGAPGWILLAATAFTAICIYSALRLELRLGFADQLGDDTEEARQLAHVNKNYGGMDFVFITIEGGDRAQRQEYARRLKERLLTLTDYVTRVNYRIDVDHFARYALLFLTPEEIRSLEKTLDAAGGSFAELFADPGPGPFHAALGELLEAIVLGEEDIEDEADFLRRLSALERWVEMIEGSMGGETVAQETIEDRLDAIFFDPVSQRFPDSDREGAFVTRDGSMLLMLVSTVSGDFDYSINTLCMAAIDGEIEGLADAFPQLNVGTTGNISVMRDENLALRYDMTITSAIALVLILCIFAIAFKRIRFVIIVGVPLMMGICWTLGATQWAIGYFSIFTSIFGAILLGLGIDFAIHLVSRYQEERAEGYEPAQAMELALQIAGSGIITGGFTTASAFFTLCLARFKGLSQMGFIAGIGIVFSLAAMLIVLPALIGLFERRGWFPVTPQQDIGNRMMENMTHFFMKRQGWVWFMAISLSLLSAWGLARSLQAGFMWDFRALEPEGMASIETMKRLEVAQQSSIDYGIVLSEDIEDDRRLVAELEKKETIGRVDAISDFVPDRQEEKAPALARLAPTLANVPVPRRPEPTQREAFVGQWSRFADSLKGLLQLTILAGQFDWEDRCRALHDRALKIGATLSGADATLGAALEARLDDFGQRLAPALEKRSESLRSMSGVDRIGLEDLPPALRETYQGKDGKFIIYAYPQENIWNKPFMTRNVAQLKEVQSGALGIAVIFSKMVDDILEDFRTSSFLALAAVCVFLILDFKRPLTVLLTLLPLLMGAFWMVGAMGLLGMQFNLINVIIVPILLGIGIDDGVHIVHRYRSEGVGGAEKTMKFTGKAVLLTSLTTMAGFGAIGFATHQGLASMGVSLFMGIGFCYLSSSIVLPILISRVESRIRL